VDERARAAVSAPGSELYNERVGRVSRGTLRAKSRVRARPGGGGGKTQAVRAVAQRLLVTARKFPEHGGVRTTKLPGRRQIEGTPRELPPRHALPVQNARQTQTAR